MRKSLLLVLVCLAFVFSGCKKEEVKPNIPLQIKNNNIVLTRDATEKIKVVGVEKEVTYSSENDYIASVDDNGVIKGRIKGKTIITAKSGDKTAICNVEVKTRINFIPEPYLGFGENYNKVKSELEKRKGEVVELDDNNLGQMIKIDGDVFMYLYTFKGGRLDLSGFSLSVTATARNSVVDFLLERYIVGVKTGTYSYGMLTPDKKVGVFMRLSNSKERIDVIYTSNKK